MSHTLFLSSVPVRSRKLVTCHRDGSRLYPSQRHLSRLNLLDASRRNVHRDPQRKYRFVSTSTRHFTSSGFLSRLRVRPPFKPHYNTNFGTLTYASYSPFCATQTRDPWGQRPPTPLLLPSRPRRPTRPSTPLWLDAKRDVSHRSRLCKQGTQSPQNKVELQIDKRNILLLFGHVYYKFVR